MKISLDVIKRDVREIFSEPNGGTLSWGRIASTVLLLVMVYLDIHFFLKAHLLPNFGGQSELIISPYAANKLTTALQSFSPNPVSPTAPVPAAPPVVPPPMVPPPAAQ